MEVTNLHLLKLMAIQQKLINKNTSLIRQLMAQQSYQDPNAARELATQELSAEDLESQINTLIVEITA